jgi:hypothetical protein
MNIIVHGASYVKFEIISTAIRLESSGSRRLDERQKTSRLQALDFGRVQTPVERGKHTCTLYMYTFFDLPGRHVQCTCATSARKISVDGYEWRKKEKRDAAKKMI